MSQMTLADAMRLGAMSTTQGKGGSMVPGGTRCALAAAADACGMEPVTLDAVPCLPYCALVERFPILATMTTHPATGEDYSVATVIWTLNDRHGWTREQIAAWVSQIEEARRAEAEGQPQPETVATAVRRVPHEA